MIINYNYDVTGHFVILSFHCFLSDLNVQKPVSQCTVTNTSGTVSLTNIPKPHTTEKLDVIKDDTQTNERSKNIVMSDSKILPTQQKTLCSKTTIGAIAHSIGNCFVILSFHCFLSDLNMEYDCVFYIGVLPTQKTLCSKTTICAIAIAIGIGFLAIVIPVALVFANSEGKGGELVTIYNSF